MNKIGANRLLKLADLLDTVPIKDLDMSVWRRGCGTVACALGHACLSPKFRGLVLNSSNIPILTKDPYIQSINAAEQYFSITNGQACDLFLPGMYKAKYPHPKTVANRIRKFVEAS